MNLTSTTLTCFVALFMNGLGGIAAEPILDKASSLRGASNGEVVAGTHLHQDTDGFDHHVERELKYTPPDYLLPWVLPLYEYFDPYAHDHFYTTDINEFGLTPAHYDYEGILGYLSTDSGAGVTLYEYLNTHISDHLYTFDFDEFGSGSGGYAYKGVLGYLSDIETPHLVVPLYRYWNEEEKDTLLTTDFDEYNGVHGKDGYTYVCLVGYICQAIEPTASPTKKPIKKPTKEPVHGPVPCPPKGHPTPPKPPSTPPKPPSTSLKSPSQGSNKHPKKPKSPSK